MGKAVGTLFYLLSGFCLYGACLVSFVSPATSGIPLEGKLYITGGFMGAGLVFLLVGLLANRFRNWQQHSGIVVIVSTGLAVLGTLTIIFALMDENFDKFYPDGRATFMKLGDTTTGFAVSGVMALLGLILVLWHRRAPGD